MMSDNILEIRELSKDYGDFVLDKVSFSLPRSVIMGLIGESGHAGERGRGGILIARQSLEPLPRRFFQMCSL